MTKANKRKCLFIILIIAVFILAYSFLEPFWLEEKTIEITSAHIPPQFHGATVVFLTDIHHGPFFSRRRVKRLVERVNGLEPDIILLGGDYVHRDAKYIEPCFAELKGLKAPFGLYGVLGNHDHWEGAVLTRQSMQEAGIRLIDNAAFWIEHGGARIKIGGVGDYYEDIQDIAPTVFDVAKEDFVILVTHNPDYVQDMQTDKIDVVFAGHTHGGQVTFFGQWAPLIPSAYGQKFRTGTLQEGNAQVIISHGVGTITPPVRFFARPQIIIGILESQ